MERTDYNII